VVTGKLDVREVAARLLKQAPEVELLDEIAELSQGDSTTEDDLSWRPLTQNENGH